MGLQGFSQQPAAPAPNHFGFLRTRGALSEATQSEEDRGDAEFVVEEIPAALRELVPESFVREHLVIPLAFDGERVTLASADADNIALADKLRFLLAKDVRLVAAPLSQILEAIERNYGVHRPVPAAFMEPERAYGRERRGGLLGRLFSLPDVGRYLGKGIVEFKKGLKGLKDEISSPPTLQEATGGAEGGGMFVQVIEEGERVLVKRRDGSMEIVAGPKRLWRWGKTFYRMQQYVAHPGKFLAVRFRDGRQEHLPGPAEVWADPRVHQQITLEDALQLSAKEAVVVYTQDGPAVTRRLVFGPAVFVPRPGEWLHTFSWHASKGGSRGQQKVPHGLVFQKLWLMPDQMYHDVTEVRTADDAVLTVRLMIFFELTDIERMLDATHDPIGDFVNAATSDVVSFTGRHDFEAFKSNVGELNELETYRQLTGRAAQCGYRINKVVYRGYGSADALQLMHDQAIQARTKLQLDRATEEQAQDLEDYKLSCQLARAKRRREEQTSEVQHDLGLGATKQQADLTQCEARETFQREARRRQAEMQLAVRRDQDEQQRAHLAALREMGVDLTAYLTQGRADQVIELRGRGGAQPHLHLDKSARAGHNDGQ